jgi:hypothetical protein
MSGWKGLRLETRECPIILWSCLALGRLMAPSFDPGRFASPDHLRPALRQLTEELLSFYARETSRIEAALPPERSLVIPTEDLSTSLDTLAEFAGVTSFTGDVLARLARGYQWRRRLYGRGRCEILVSRLTKLCLVGRFGRRRKGMENHDRSCRWRARRGGAEGDREES